MPFKKSKRTNTLKPSAFNLSNGDRRSSKEPHNSIFETLPLELLQNIARLSSTSAASSLALCSKFICAAVGGPQYWTKLRSEPLELENFLCFFEKDNPGYWLCRPCTIFHPHQRGFRRTSAYNYIRKETLNCLHSKNPHTGCLSKVYSNPPHPINHWMVQMAMNRHLWGPEHGLSLNVLSQSRRGHNCRSEPEIHFSTEARIFANELYLRCQYSFSVSSSTDDDVDFSWLCGFAICDHIRLDAGDLIRSFVRYKLSRLDAKDGKGCMDLIQCQYCHTEFDLEILQPGPTDYVLEFTSWKNLGSGRTPNDPKWLQHAHFSRLYIFPMYRSPSFPLPTFSPGSIRTAFETGKLTNPPESIPITKNNRCPDVVGT